MSFLSFIFFRWPAFFILLLLPLLVYFPALHYEFVWDDHSFLVDNKSIVEDASWEVHFTDQNAQAESPEAKIYRPIRNLSYRLEYRLFGLNPFWFHLDNLLLHGLNGALLFLLARFCFQSTPGKAWILCLFFLLHPLQSEVVCWVKSRDDLLAVFFGALAFLFFHLYLKTPKLRRLLTFILFYLLALFSKESSLCLCAVFYLWALNQKPELNTGKKTYLLILILLPSLLYLFLRLQTLGQVGQDSFYLAGSFWKTQLGMALVYRDYLLKILLPWDQRVNYMGFDPFSLHSETTALFTWGLFACLFLWIACRSQSDTRLRLYFFILSFIPVSNLIPMMQWEAERFLYFPIFFFSLFLEKALPDLENGKTKKNAVIFTFFYLFFLVFQTTQREKIWQNDKTLGLSMLASNPDSYHGLLLVLDYNRTHEMHEENVRLAKLYLARFPSESLLYDYLTFSYLRQGRFDLAKQTLTQGLAYFPKSELLMNFQTFLNSQNTENKSVSGQAQE